MSASQYKKVLAVAEALLRKVEMPEETILKYDELKNKILGEEQHDIAGQLSNELISVYQFFIETFVNFMSEVAMKGSAEGLSDNLITPFLDEFEVKKKELRDMILDASVTIEQRLLLKQHLSALDEMEVVVDRALSCMDGIQELISHSSDIQEKQAVKIQKMEDELDNTMTELKNNTSIRKELEVVMIERDDLSNRLKLSEIELSELKSKVENLKLERQTVAETEGKQMVELSTQLAETQQLASRFCEHFTQFSELYEGPTDTSNFEEMVQFACEFAEKLEGDNRWLLGKVNECEEAIEEFKQKLELVDQQHQKKVKSVTQFVGELENHVQQSERVFSDVDALEAEYRQLISRGIIQVN